MLLLLLMQWICARFAVMCALLPNSSAHVYCVHDSAFTCDSSPSLAAHVLSLAFSIACVGITLNYRVSAVRSCS